VRALWPELERARGGPLRLHPEAASCLLEHGWPRNVRELRQVLMAAAVLADDGLITSAHLPALVPARALGDSDQRVDEDDERLRTELLRLFALHRGNVTQVARALGKARVQVQRWMKRFAIDPSHFRDPGA
jgi:transcriptional regulator of acetoin/glycerol metabolism